MFLTHIYMNIYFYCTPRHCRTKTEQPRFEWEREVKLFYFIFLNDDFAFEERPKIYACAGPLWGKNEKLIRLICSFFSVKRLQAVQSHFFRCKIVNDMVYVIKNQVVQQ